MFDRRTFRGLTVTNRICLVCGMVFQFPYQPEAELQQFYAAEYRKLYQGDEGPSAGDLAVQQARAEALLHFVEPEIKTLTRHLDIGCSSGALLKRFKAAYGCQPAGVEPGDAYRDYARAHQLRVYATLEELRAAGSERFDLISMAHVLEHIPAPVEYLASLRQNFLDGNAYLLLEVPNLYIHDSFEVAHLASFSPHTLKETVKKAGFSVLAIQVHGRPRSRVLPLYITLLARPLQAPPAGKIRPERFVPLKRRLGMGYRVTVSRLLPGLAWLPVAGKA
ncbi:MAG: class I SAM-dependent methyltransferase [Omnitrophica WOR_2 bacterium]